MNVNTLSKKLNEDLKLEISSEDYIHSVDQLFEGPWEKDVDAGQILTRAFQDHNASCQHLQELVHADICKALDVFLNCDSKTIMIFVECFHDTDDSMVLMHEIHSRIRSNSPHIEYLLSLTIQLLNKFNYKFKDVRFLVRELSLRIKQLIVKPLALVIFALLDKQFGSAFENYLIGFIESLMIEAQLHVKEDSLSIVMGILTELYPALSTLCSRIFLGQEFQTLVKENSTYDTKLGVETLQLLSAACVDENARAHIAENYLDLLEKSLKISEFKLYATLVLVKTWSFTKLKVVSIDQLAANLMETLQDKDQTHEQVAIEGLAYLSLKVSTKQMLRSHGDVCLKIVDSIKDGDVEPANKYGALVICANLSTLPSDVEPEQKSLQNLKSYSELKTPKNDSEDIKENDEDVISFNQDYLLDLDVVGSLKGQLKSLTASSRLQAAKIIYNITRTKENINSCIQQGGVAITLEILANSSLKTQNRIFALRSLTRMLIFTNPVAIFQRFSALNTLPYLFELLPDPDALDTDYDLMTKDTYEALLALTNIATLSENDDICKEIVSNSSYWMKIENTMLDETVEVQRSCLELCSNLMAESLHIAVKFFNFDNPKSLRNFNLLVKLLHLDDIKSQRAVAAIFANISSTVPFIAQELLKREELVEAEIELLQSQSADAELRHRILIFFDAILDAAPTGNNIIHHNQDFLKALNVAKGYENDSSPEYSSLIDSLLKCAQG